MKFSIDGQVVLLRAPEGLLEACIERFAGSLSEQGYAPDRFTGRFLSARVLAIG